MRLIGGGAVTVTLFVVELLAPLSSVTVSDTEYVLPCAYVCEGLVAVDVVLSPNVQLDDAMLPSESVLVFVNEQVSPLQLDEKFAVGGAFVGGVAVTVTLFVTWLVAPLSSVTVSETE